MAVGRVLAHYAGSVESTGIVTDVGVFLNVLARQLLD